MALGLIHVYCGNGKGKTTSVLGLSMRAAGRGLKVLFVQFLKSRKTGELESLKLIPNIEVLRGKETTKFTFQMNDEEKKIVWQEHAALFNTVQDKISQGKYDLLVLDEVIGACNNKVFDGTQLIRFLQNKPEHLEVALTGRNPSEAMRELVAYVSEIIPVKHPFNQGIPARDGIER